MDSTLDQDGDTIMTDAPPLSPPLTPPADPWSDTGFNFGTVVRNPRFNPPPVASSSPDGDNSQPDFPQPRPRAPRRLGISVDKKHSGATADTARQSGSRRPRGVETGNSDVSRQGNARWMVDLPGRSQQSDQQKWSDNLGEQMTSKRQVRQRRGGG
ncbi:Ff.00g112270.m01.CDS01 [Fusarium sp. VM40]|nr:Ff.00g112270.m01.CDS01 [Fusarium sp. VM40]